MCSSFRGRRDLLVDGVAAGVHLIPLSGEIRGEDAPSGPVILGSFFKAAWPSPNRV